MAEQPDLEVTNPIGMDDRITTDVVKALRDLYSDEDADINGGDLVEALGFLFGPNHTRTDRFWGLVMLENMTAGREQE